MPDEATPTASPLPTVSVVVPTHDRRDNLPRVLPPLLDDPAALEVVVVVDGSTDGTVELLERMSAEHPRLVVEVGEGLGAVGANQRGLERARGDVVLFVDDDVVARPGLVTGHARRHAEATARVVVGYMPTDRPAPRRPGTFATYLYADEYEARAASYERDQSLVLQRLWMGNVSLRRDDALRVGLAPGGDFGAARHGDRDFGVRCAKAGLEGVFDRALAGDHVHHRTLAQFVGDSRRQGRGRAMLHLRYPDVVESPEAELLRGAGAPVRALLRAARHESLRRPLTAALGAAVAGAGRVRAFRAETAAARLLRRVEQQHGALATLREAGGAAPGAGDRAAERAGALR